MIKINKFCSSKFCSFDVTNGFSYLFKFTKLKQITLEKFIILINNYNYYKRVPKYYSC